MEWLKILIAVIASTVSVGGTVTIWLKYYYKRKIKEIISKKSLKINAYFNFFNKKSAHFNWIK